MNKGGHRISQISIDRDFAAKGWGILEPKDRDFGAKGWGFCSQKMGFVELKIKERRLITIK